MNRSRASSLLYLAPFLLFAGWFFLPVALGRETLYIRDVLNIHLVMKWVWVEAVRDGYLPLIDLLRAGGQPHLGNPNSVALYPDNVLFLFASPIWGVNAHFWLHLLLAPVSVYWLGRQVELSRAGAWTAGVCYATGGYYLSTLNLYNLTASVTLGPALVAATIALARAGAPGTTAGREVDARAGRRALVASTLLWTSVLLGGDPMLAVALLGVAIAAAILAGPGIFATLRRIAWPIGIGSLLAAPQWVEFLRIAPGSYRGVKGYSAAAATAASWSPANLFEWLLPLAFGKPDLLFWGHRFHAGYLPLLYSLAPGLIALALAVTGARSGWKWNRFSWSLVGVGFFFALGSYNPIVEWLFGLPGMGIFRLPVKLWVVAAIGLGLATGRGMDHWLARTRSRRLERVLLLFCLLGAAVAVAVVAFPSAVDDLIVGWMPAALPAEHAADEVRRWLRLSLAAVGLCAAAWALVRFPRRRRELAGVALVALHCAAQGWFLGPLVATDSIEPYLRPSPLLEVVPADGRIVHGDANTFGRPVGDRTDYPDERTLWLQRDVFARLFPPAGILWGLRFEFWLSPEGLDSFLSRSVAGVLNGLDDPGRLSFLEASGVTHVLLGRDLEGVDDDRAELVARRAAGTTDVRIYELKQAAAEVEFVGRVLRSTDPLRTANMLLDPTFDPRQSTVVSGPGDPTLGSSGSVEIVRTGDEEIVVDVEATGPGAIVVQRSYLPIWVATIDGEPAEISVANMHRMAVEVPPGSHRLEIWVDRGTLVPSFALSALALLLLWLHLRRWSPSAGREAVVPGV